MSYNLRLGRLLAAVQPIVDSVCALWTGREQSGRHPLRSRCMEPLEARQYLAVQTFPGTPDADQFSISLSTDAQSVIVSRTGGSTSTYLRSQLTSLIIEASGGNDSLTCDLSRDPSYNLDLIYKYGSGANTLTLNGGQITLSAGLTLDDHQLSVTLNNNSRLAYADTPKLHALTLNGTSRFILTDGLYRPLELDSLGIAAGAALDLMDNGLILHHQDTDHGVAKLQQLVGYICQSIVDAGTWEGPGLCSSTAAAHPDGIAALAILNNDDDLGNALFSRFMSHNVDERTILVKYTYFGDADLDGPITGNDFALTDAGWQMGLDGWVNGDFNYDGVVTGDDYALLDTCYQLQGAPKPEFTVSGITAYPEGGSCTLDLSASTVGVDPISYWTIHWGDGQVNRWDGSSAVASHAYAATSGFGPFAIDIYAKGTWLNYHVDMLSTGPVPAAPNSVWAQVYSGSRIDVHWTDCSGIESGFVIEQSLTGTGGWSYAGSAPANSSSVSLAGPFAPATTYYFRVRAQNASGISSASASASVATGAFPAAPSNLTATAISATQIQLTWTDNSTNETCFQLERSVDGVTWRTFTIASNATDYLDTTELAPGTHYRYRLAAMNTSGQSGYSTAEATTRPGAPTGLTATPSLDYISLQWQAAPGAERYNLYRRNSGSLDWGQPYQAGIAGTSFIDDKIVNGSAEYEYAVEAVNIAGPSLLSNTASVLPYPAAPTNLRALPNYDDDGDYYILLSWFGIGSCTDYRIYIDGAEGPTVTGNSWYHWVLAPGEKHTYKVCARNATGQSYPSREVSAATDPLPLIPCNLAVEAKQASGNTWDVSISWTNVDYACNYVVHRSGGGLPEEDLGAGGGGMLYPALDPDLPNGTYYYSVEAFDVNGDSRGPSAEITVTLPLGASTQKIDIDVDSDNDDRVYPDWTQQGPTPIPQKYASEESIEGNSSCPGVYVPVSDPGSTELRYVPLHVTTIHDSIAQVTLTHDSHLEVYFDTALTSRVVPGWSYGRLAIQGKILYIKATAPGAGQITISGSDSQGQSWGDTVRATGVAADVDLDSDNNGTLDAQDDLIEHRADVPGQIVPVNDGDDDGDGIPNYADGYNYDRIVSDDDTSSAPNGPQRFVPVTFRIPDPVDPTKACMRINYLAADPANIKRTAPGYAEDPFAYSPNHSGIPATPTTNGRIRLWTKPSTSPRSLESFMEGDNPTMGYYVPPTAGSAEPEPQSLAGMLEQLLEQEGGEQVAGTGETLQTLSEDFYGPDAIARLGGTSGQFTLYLEAVDVSRTLADQLIRFEIDPDGEGPAGFVVADVVHVTAVRVDLDIDSDNNNGLDQPDGTDHEDSIEDNDTQPGKVITVNDDDSDDDGVPDFADGYDWRNGDLIASPPHTADDSSPYDQFVPLVLEMPDHVDIGLAKFRFEYSANNPESGVSITADGGYSLTDDGRLRIWRKDAYEARGGTDVDTGGDFVSSGTWYAPHQLNFDLERQALCLWVEAVRPSTSLADLRITVEIDPDGDGPAGSITADAVRLTAFRTTLFAVGADGSVTPVEYTETSYPTPQFSNINVVVSNLRLNADKTRILGDVAVTGTLDDAASDLIPGPMGTITEVAFALNGQSFAILPTNISKSRSRTSILKPYDFSATFAATLSGVELQPGVNLFHLTADNMYGLSGFAETSVEILLEAPPPQTYEYEIRVTEDPYANSSLGLSIEFRTRPAGGAWDGWRMLSRQDFDTFSVADPVMGATITDIVLDQPLDGTGQDNTAWVTVTDPATENKGEVVKLTLDRIDNEGGIQKAVWKGQWTREDHDLDDLSLYDMLLGERSPVVLSDGGCFHPVLIGIDGPIGLVDFMDQATVGESQYDLIRYNDHLVFALPGENAPRAFLSTANLAQLSGPPETPIDDPAVLPPNATAAGFDTTDFALGVGAGLLQTIPDTAVGLWDGVKFLAKQVWYNNTPHMIYRLIRTGDALTVEDRRRWETAKGIAVKVAEVAWKIQQDRQAFIYALQMGDDQTLNALGEEYQIAFEFAAEMLEALWDDLMACPDYEKGKIVGRIVGEVVLTVASSLVTGGGAAAAKGTTMANVAAKLKQVSYLQRFASKFDELIVLYNKIDEMAAAVEGLGGMMGNVKDGKVISQRIASIVLHHQQKTGEGYWKSFEAFLNATADIKRRASVDSRLAFAASYVMRLSYKEAADLIRAGNVTEGLAKVPSHKRIGKVMMGRREKAKLESHHTATRYWAGQLGVPTDKLDDMPALLLNKYWHQYNSNLPEDNVFHKILREEMAGVDGTHARIVEGLRRTYRRFEGLEPNGSPATDPDVWIVAKYWLRSQGVQVP